jgi:pimeloyl-ACP methyl ester carboxylesterase
MSAPQARAVQVAGRPCRVSEKGSGKPLFYVPSSALSLKWSRFHEALAARARLVAVSLPGFAGSEGHDTIDDHLAWCLAGRDLLIAAGFRPGDTLIGASAAGAIVADIAALWPDLVGRLVLIAPFGLYDMSVPTRDIFALQGQGGARGLLRGRTILHRPGAATRRRGCDRLVDRGQPRARDGGAHPLAVRRHAPRRAPASHRCTDPAVVGRGRQGHSACLCAALRRVHERKDLVQGHRRGGHLLELDRPEETAQAIADFASGPP